MDEIDELGNCEIMEIKQNTVVERQGQVLFKYNFDEGKLWLNKANGCFAGTQTYDRPVDLCFPDPTSDKQFCFYRVLEIQCYNEPKSDGLIKRISKFVRSVF